MALDSAELVQYARDAATRGDDLYALLNVDATTAKEDIHRAWRKAGLKYHPDKAGAHYDPVKYESFERARDVLCDPAARDAYDNGLRAKLEKKRKLDEMSSTQRRFAEELERAESEAKRVKKEATEGLGAEQLKKAREAGLRRMEQRRREMKEAEERSRLNSQRSEPGVARAVPEPTMRTPPRTREVDPAREPAGQTTTSQPPAESKDEYDEREAEILRRLQAKREKKAAKKARKSDVSGLSSARWEDETKTPVKPHAPESTESKADGDKAALPSRPSLVKEYAASAPVSPAGGAKPSGGSSNFAATMARLKAAQAKRDEEKRKREADAAAAGSQQQAV
jgi:DnaJ family protein C protein 17